MFCEYHCFLFRVVGITNFEPLSLGILSIGRLPKHINHIIHADLERKLGEQ
jgi:hypothetical protein